MQAMRWINVHGLSPIGQPCLHEECEGRYEWHTWKLLRCAICHAKRSARGEFFLHYKELLGAFMLIYSIVKRWRPAQVMNEMNFRDSTRYTDMLDNIGRICTFFLEYNFKHSLGRWQRGMVDEAATGSLL